MSMPPDCERRTRWRAALALFSRLAYLPIRSIDPFSVKRWSKVHLFRVLYTVLARFIELEARINFDCYGLPTIAPPANAEGDIPENPKSELRNTKLTSVQMHMILFHSCRTSAQLQGSIVEVGSYRGVTTRALAKSTNGVVYAIDPFNQYGGNDKDFALFRANTASCKNVVHIKKTSGEAYTEFAPSSVCFVFLDAVPDFVNRRHDIMRWGDRLADGGIIAINGVDQKIFAGSRRAAWELASAGYNLVSHAHDICVFAKRRDA
jgi:predicted O-methyltransferase YrrM